MTALEYQNGCAANNTDLLPQITYGLPTLVTPENGLVDYISYEGGRRESSDHTGSSNKLVTKRINDQLKVRLFSIFTISLSDCPKDGSNFMTFSRLSRLSSIMNKCAYILCHTGKSYNTLTTFV